MAEELTYRYLVVIGVSTGGPGVLSQVLPQIDTSLSATYLVVQHMPKGLTKNLAARLNTLSALTVKEAEHNEILKKGTIYIAPSGRQLRITNGRIPKVNLMEEDHYGGHSPSITVVLQSLAKLELCEKEMLIAIMTGMGKDGLEGVKALKETRKCTVIAQDEASSVVYGMPKAVVNAGFADYIVSSDEVIKIIKRIVGE